MTASAADSDAKDGKKLYRGYINATPSNLTSDESL